MIRSLFRQRLGSARRHWALQFSTLVVVTACYLVVSLSVLLSQNLRKILTVWGEDLQMTVYLSEGTGEPAVTQLQAELEHRPHIGKVHYVSKESALTEFRSQMASYAPDVFSEKDVLSLIPASFQVSLSESLDPRDHLKTLESLADDLKQNKSVAEVSYGQDWVQKYSRFLHYFERICQALGMVILCAALFVLSNVIRASVQSRRQEIEVLELIGATPAMIRRPFIAEGALIGFVSSLAAVGLSYCLYKALVGVFENELQFLQLAQHFSYFALPWVVVAVLLGTLLGALGSYLCVRQINDGWAARTT